MNILDKLVRDKRIRDKYPHFYRMKKHYSFYPMMDGYLIYKSHYPRFYRTILLFAKGVVKKMMDWREENDRVNSIILKELGLPENSKISELDAFYKKTFRKLKYIYYFKGSAHKDFPEPQKTYFSFFASEPKISSKKSPVDFFKSIGEEAKEAEE